MIIFFESGRLGNQLFQYCAMRKYQPYGRIFAVGMWDLKTVFYGVDFAGSTNFDRLFIRMLLTIGEQRIAFITRRFRLLTLVEEVTTACGVSFKVTPGLLRRITYFPAGYYQSETIVEKNIVNRISVRGEILDQAKQRLLTCPCPAQDRIFVHVRRGDYICWPDRDAPAVLPLTWYRTRMTRIHQVHPNAFFFIFSDDLPYVEEFFADQEKVIIVKGDMMSHFATMIQCEGGGVLSASSFSWWVAYLIRRKNPRAQFVAPMFWAGHRRGTWFPLGIQTSWLNYSPVEEI